LLICICFVISVTSIETELSDDNKKDVDLSRQNLTELPEK